MEIYLYEHKILYEEKSPYHTYIAVVSRADSLEIQAVLAYSEENAEKVLLDRGVESILTIFPLMEMMQVMEGSLEVPAKAPLEDSDFFYDKGDNLIH